MDGSGWRRAQGLFGVPGCRQAIEIVSAISVLFGCKNMCDVGKIC